jgi:lipoprotein-releasing system permease protein
LRLPLFIAYRYLFSKKKINAINIITAIAVLGFGVGAFAMIVVLSAFNGFENLIDGLINNYDPAIQITAKGKKTFQPGEDLFKLISTQPEVESIVPCLEEKVVIKYNNKQEIARIKGVGESFNAARFDTLMVLGQFKLRDTSGALGVFGGGLASKLSLFPGNQSFVTVFVPKRNVNYNSLNPQESLSTEFLRASSVFSVHEEIDNEVFLTDLDFAQRLLDYEGSVSSLELNLKSEDDLEDLRDRLKERLGDAYSVKTRTELNELIYKIFSSEKWFTYAILALVLVISSFNIFGSLIMLVLDKKKDIGILKSMGATDKDVKSVFLWQGNYIATLGGASGVFLAVVLVLLQKQFGWLKLENSIVESYPVALQWGDIVVTLGTVILLGFIISLYPAYRAGQTKIQSIN